MGTNPKVYRFTRSVDPASRIDRIEVGGGKVLELNGEPKELSDDEVAKLSKYVVLEEADIDEVVPESPDDPNAAQIVDVDAISLADLKKLASELQVEGRSSMSEDELRAAVKDHYNTKEV